MLSETRLVLVVEGLQGSVKAQGQFQSSPCLSARG